MSKRKKYFIEDPDGGGLVRLYDKVDAYEAKVKMRKWVSDYLCRVFGYSTISRLNRGFKNMEGDIKEAHKSLDEIQNYLPEVRDDLGFMHAQFSSVRQNFKEVNASLDKQLSLNKTYDNAFTEVREAISEQADKNEEYEAGLNEVSNALAAKQDALTTSADLAISADSELSLTDIAKKRLFIDQWNRVAGTDGTYNEDTGHFELNGLTDITYEQAIDIMQSASAIINAPVDMAPSMALKKIRTHFPLTGNGNGLGSIHSKNTFKYCGNLEVSIIRGGNYKTFSSTYYECVKLRKVVVNSGYSTDFIAAFAGCVALEDFSITSSINSNINFEHSPKLSLASVQNIVQKGNNGITVTVHPDVYAKLTGDTTNAAAAALTPEELAQWQTLVTTASAKNISFATV